MMLSEVSAADDAGTQGFEAMETEKRAIEWNANEKLEGQKVV